MSKTVFSILSAHHNSGLCVLRSLVRIVAVDTAGVKLVNWLDQISYLARR